MRRYNLNIAGYNIGFEADESAPDLMPSERFLRNITQEIKSDILVTVHSEKFTLPQDAEKVFHAPFVEEVNGIQIRHKTNFWSVWKNDSDLFIQTIFPRSAIKKNAVLRFSLTGKDWDLWIDSEGNDIDPFDYPLDGLILYYITVINSDIMIHASGVTYGDHGYVFSGVSGKGKTTIARLWENAGAKVIHDDRLILRNTGNGFKMFNTPVYSNDNPLESGFDKIFIIDHGIENKLVAAKEAAAVSLVMANCIQHNWNREIISRLLSSVTLMCTKIPVVKLTFTPDKSIIDYIIQNERQPEHY